MWKLHFKTQYVMYVAISSTNNAMNFDDVLECKV